MLRGLFIICVLAQLVCSAAPALASTACLRDDGNLRPLPAALVPAAQKLFGLQNADPAWVERSTVVRCMGGRLWACNVGANLPCGKADFTSSLPAGDGWCEQNPNSDFIPAYITGHDTAEQWRCRDGTPATTGPPAPVDRQGYLTNYWKILK